MTTTRTASMSDRQRGGAIVLLLLLIGAITALAAFASDSVRMTADAAQLKRATDAAAMAGAMARAKDRDVDIQTIAARYVAANLGMDTAQLDSQLQVTASAITQDDSPGSRVTASFPAASRLSGTESQAV
ncbi:MAG TPA: hypothetical protein VGC24_06550 [Burkholderiaceae bacterium]